MKFISKLILAATLIACTLTASAQRSLDTFGAPRTLNLGVNSLGAAQTVVTNGPYDIRMYDGITKITIFNGTNSNNAGGTLTCQIYTSADQTNLTALTYALAVNKQIKYTNGYYAALLYGTNNWVLPGTITTPSSAQSWVSPYLSVAPFTNTAAVTITTTGVYEVGFNAGDVGRYLYLVYTPGGTTTNFTCGATMTGFTHDTLTQ